MSVSNNDAGAVPASPQRRAKKLLAPSVKYEIFLQLVRGETTINQAAEAAGVDRSTIMKLRQWNVPGLVEGGTYFAGS